MAWLICAGRSLLFHVCFILFTLLLGVVGIIAVLGPKRWIRWLQLSWSHGTIFMARTLLGIQYQVLGMENLPSGPCIIASKHQSAWETIAFITIFSPCVFVLKRELLKIPVFGWFAMRTRQIVVDRGAGASAVRHLIAEGKRVRKEGFRVVLFPEGTRVRPTTAPPLKPGIVAMARYLDYPIVPVSLDSGRLWGRQGLIMHPGLITITVRPVLPKQASKDRMLSDLHHAINIDPKQ